MKFIIDNISKSSGRLGHLIHAESGKQFKTPLLLQTTKGGSIPYVSREVFEYISKEVQLLQMSLANIDHMAESFALYNGPLSSYVGFKGYPTLMTMRDPCEAIPSGHNDRDVVPLFTRRGKQAITAQKFMDLIETFQPDMYQGLCDADTNATSAKKRVQKSVDRTESLMETCYERHEKSNKLKNSTLFAPIVGGFSTHARSQSIKHAKTKHANSYGGYLLEGFHSYGLTATEVPEEDLLKIVDHSLKEMDDDKPRMMLGAYTPAVTLELVRLGVDMFDSSYAYCAAVNFKALVFNFQLGNGQKQQQKDSAGSDALLDLTDEGLKESFTPLLDDCKCLTCQKHTRAYVHHLFKTRELLGPILLMIHNLHHYMEFFGAIHRSIASDNLAELIKLIKFQSTSTEVDYSIKENPSLKSKNGTVKSYNAI